MGRDKNTEEATLEEAAVELVDEVLAPWKGLVSEEELLIMRVILEGELLVDPEGRLELRRMVADPVVDTSDELPRKLPNRDRDDEEDVTGREGS